MSRHARAATPGLILLGLLILGGPVAPSTSADDPPPKADDPKAIEDKAARKEAAQKAADAFLVLLDKGKYGESWELGSDEFRKGIPRQKWVEAAAKTRKPFGKLQARKLNRIELRAAKDPAKLNQAWIYTDLKFQTGEPSAELVVVYFEKDKDWKPAAYFIGDPATFPKPPEPDKK